MRLTSNTGTEVPAGLPWPAPRTTHHRTHACLVTHHICAEPYLCGPGMQACMQRRDPAACMQGAGEPRMCACWPLPFPLVASPPMCVHIAPASSLLATDVDSPSKSTPPARLLFTPPAGPARTCIQPEAELPAASEAAAGGAQRGGAARLQHVAQRAAVGEACNQQHNSPLWDPKRRGGGRAKLHARAFACHAP